MVVFRILAVSLFLNGLFSVIEKGFIFNELKGIAISQAESIEYYTTIWVEKVNLEGIITLFIGLIGIIVLFILERRFKKNDKHRKD